MFKRPQLAAGQEWVWDYPRPPRLERDVRPLRVEFGGAVIAETTAAWRCLETSHPPTFYLPPGDVRFGFLRESGRRTWCEFKGEARYWTVAVGERVARNAAWSYPDPVPAYAALRDHVAFYASMMDRCLVDGTPVARQEGDFYGGWITPEVVGPFKGAAGTRWW